MSGTGLEQFIVKYFGKVPKWVRSTTYLLAFVTWIYLILSPSYLDGKMVTIDPGNEAAEVPFIGAGFISVYTDGRQIKVITNSDGV